jgi:hypothetical protein
MALFAGYIVSLIIKHSKDYKLNLAYNENRIKLFEDIYSQLIKVIVIYPALCKT